jgi:hypothetical protein
MITYATEVAPDAPSPPYVGPQRHYAQLLVMMRAYRPGWSRKRWLKAKRRARRHDQILVRVAEPASWVMPIIYRRVSTEKQPIIPVKS